MKLLIIEDERGLSDSVVRFLGSEDYLCEQAFTYSEAAERIGMYEYDCILLDLMLPGGTGIDLLERIKEVSPRTWGIVLAGGKLQPARAVGGSTWLFLILSGLATGLSWLFYFKALQLGDASKVAPLDKLSVVFTIVLAVVILKEPLTLKVALGATLITAGAIVLMWK